MEENIRCEELQERIDYLQSIVQEYEKQDYFAALSRDHRSQESCFLSKENFKYKPSYGDLTDLNSSRVILDSVGKDTLQAIAEDAIDLLQTSVAIYEANGDYAFGMFSSGWCRLMDDASRKLCKTESNIEALRSGLWLCHENCWNDAAKAAIDSGRCIDIQCVGGINLYAESIYADDLIIGAINIGYGTPPQDPEQIKALSETFQVSEQELYNAAKAYQPRPGFLINLAKKRLNISARLIGQIVSRTNALQALKKSEEDFRTTFNSIGDAVIATDLKGCISRMNPVAEKLTGWPIQEAKAKPLSEVFRICNAFSREICDNPVQKVLEQGKIQGLANHTVLMAKNGREYQIADSAAPIRNELGELSGVVLVFRDVTEKYLQDQALRASDERLNLALQATNTGLWDWNVQTGQIVFNEQWAAIIGYSLEELKPLSLQTWTESCHPDDLEASNARLAEHLAGKTDYYECEARVKHRDGSWIWILDRGRVVEWDRAGRALRMIGIHTDITLRKQAEKALRKSEERFQKLLALVPDMVSIHDPQMNILYSNWKGLANVPEEKRVLNTKCYKTYRGYDHICPDCEAKNVLVSKKAFQKELKLSDGSWMDLRVLPMLDEHERVEFFVEWVRDITEKKDMERMLFLEKEKYRDLFEASPDAIAIVDEAGKFLTANFNMAQRFNMSQEELQGKTYAQVLPEEVAVRRLEKGKQAIEQGQLIVFQDERAGRYYHNYYLPNSNWDKQKSFQVISRDITAQKQYELELQYLSLYDKLTGLYNRAFFEEEMRRIATERNCPIGIIVCDIDGLKLTNDALGNEQGDQVLVTFGKLLRGCFRLSEVVARIGGDEFAVLLPQSSRKIVNSCCKRIRAEVDYYNQQHPESGLSISIGSAVQENPPVHMNKLYKRADKAMYKEKLQHSLSSRSATVQALIKTMEARDYITEGHAGRLQDYALKLGRFIDLPEESLNDLQLLARFHDLGKVGVPDQILFKPGPLSKEEYEEMKRHSEMGQRIALSTSDLTPIADYILKHHEYWDGRGYPLGIKGKEIPVECRILSIVDAYDAMISDRPYRRAMSCEEALQELRRCAGTQFDPELVEMFMLVLKENNITTSLDL